MRSVLDHNVRLTATVWESIAEQLRLPEEPTQEQLQAQRDYEASLPYSQQLEIAYYRKPTLERFLEGPKKRQEQLEAIERARQAEAHSAANVARPGEAARDRPRSQTDEALLRNRAERPGAPQPRRDPPTTSEPNPR